MPGHPQGIFQKEVIHWKRPAGHREARSPTEVAAKQVFVHGGRHQDDLEVSAPAAQVPQRQQQEVALDAALVDLVDDDVRGAVEVRILLQAPQQDACRAEEQARARSRLLLQPHRVTDGASDRLPALVGHALGDADGTDPARLSAHHGARRSVVRCILHDVLCNLRGLPAACLTLHDDDLVLHNGPQDLGTMREHRQRLPRRAQRGVAHGVVGDVGRPLLPALDVCRGRPGRSLGGRRLERVRGRTLRGRERRGRKR
mmetsp:Transcript_165480/g.526058  ORF Transcript_165480/g.526058 Transcript_165480/m.526058 type:complete len:257 (+) Transcript_165480:2098-2868(+)